MNPVFGLHFLFGCDMCPCLPGEIGATAEEQIQDLASAEGAIDSSPTRDSLAGGA